MGADPQPWFRIFNPVLQGQRFDPEGDWVRRWVPELAHASRRATSTPRGRCPQMRPAAAGVRLGESYPRPIVDLQAGRERALAAFRSVTAAGAGEGTGG